MSIRNRSNTALPCEVILTVRKASGTGYFVALAIWSLQKIPYRLSAGTGDFFGMLRCFYFA